MNSTFSLVRPLDPQIWSWIRIVKNFSTILSILTALLAVYMIEKSSTRSNKNYSRLQLVVIILSLSNDVIVQLIFSPHFILPLPCVTRIDPLLPIPGQASVHYVVWVIVVAEQAPAYIACFIHRHQAVLPPSTLWRLTKTAKNSFLLFYAFLVLLPAPLLWFLSPEWPSDLLDRTTCSTFELIQPFSTATLLLHTMTVSIVVTLVTHTNQQLSKSLTLSERRREYQHTMMRILILQSAFPILVQVLPNVAGFTVFVFGWSGSAVYPLILLILSTNSFALSMVVLGTTPLYRTAIRRMIFGELLGNQTQTVTLHLSSGNDISVAPKAKKSKQCHVFSCVPIRD